VVRALLDAGADYTVQQRRRLLRVERTSSLARGRASVSQALLALPLHFVIGCARAHLDELTLVCRYVRDETGVALADMDERGQLGEVDVRVKSIEALQALPYRRRPRPRPSRRVVLGTAELGCIARGRASVSQALLALPHHFVIGCARHATITTSGSTSWSAWASKQLHNDTGKAMAAALPQGGAWHGGTKTTRRNYTARCNSDDGFFASNVHLRLRGGGLR
jgi:hypothetical protein